MCLRPDLLHHSSDQREEAPAVAQNFSSLGGPVGPAALVGGIFWFSLVVRATCWRVHAPVSKHSYLRAHEPCPPRNSKRNEEKRLFAVPVEFDQSPSHFPARRKARLGFWSSRGGEGMRIRTSRTQLRRPIRTASERSPFQRSAYRNLVLVRVKKRVNLSFGVFPRTQKSSSQWEGASMRIRTSRTQLRRSTRRQRQKTRGPREQ